MDDKPGLESKFANSEIDVNEHGGKQSKLQFRFDLIPPEALIRLAHVLWYGAERYGVGNWRNIPTDDHLNHAIYHIYRHVQGDIGEDHLSHAMARITFAIEIDRLGMLKDR